MIHNWSHPRTFCPEFPEMPPTTNSDYYNTRYICKTYFFDIL